jgi:SH3-like domain-containing protein
MPFLRPPEREAPAVTAVRDALGDWVEVRNPGLRLREAPSLRGSVVDEVDPGLPLRVLAANADWYRVRLPDGRDGYVAARLTTGMARGSADELNEALTGS